MLCLLLVPCAQLMQATGASLSSMLTFGAENPGCHRIRSRLPSLINGAFERLEGFPRSLPTHRIEEREEGGARWLQDPAHPADGDGQSGFGFFPFWGRGWPPSASPHRDSTTVPTPTPRKSSFVLLASARDSHSKANRGPGSCGGLFQVHQSLPPRRGVCRSFPANGALAELRADGEARFGIGPGSFSR